MYFLAKCIKVHLLLIAVFLPGCSYATGSIHPDGSVSFVVFRPYLEKHNIQVEYNPVTKELKMNVDTQVERLDMKALGVLMGTAIGAAAKGVAIP